MQIQMVLGKRGGVHRATQAVQSRLRIKSERGLRLAKLWCLSGRVSKINLAGKGSLLRLNVPALLYFSTLGLSWLVVGQHSQAFESSASSASSASSESSESSESSKSTAQQINWSNMERLFYQRYQQRSANASKKELTLHSYQKEIYQYPTLSASLGETTTQTDSNGLFDTGKDRKIGTNYSFGLQQTLITGTSLGVSRSGSPNKAMPFSTAWTLEQPLLKGGLLDTGALFARPGLTRQKGLLEARKDYAEALYGCIESMLAFSDAKQATQVAKKRLDEVEEDYQKLEILIKKGSKAVADGVAKEAELQEVRQQLLSAEFAEKVAERTLRASFLSRPGDPPLQVSLDELPEKLAQNLSGMLTKNTETLTLRIAKLDLALTRLQSQSTDFDQYPSLNASLSVTPTGKEQSRTATLSMQWQIGGALGFSEAYEAQTQLLGAERNMVQSQESESQNFIELQERVVMLQKRLELQKKITKSKQKLASYEEERYRSGSGNIVDLESRLKETRNAEDELRKQELELNLIFLERARDLGLLAQILGNGGHSIEP